MVHHWNSFDPNCHHYPKSGAVDEGLGLRISFQKVCGGFDSYCVFLFLSYGLHLLKKWNLGGLLVFKP